MFVDLKHVLNNELCAFFVNDHVLITHNFNYIYKSTFLWPAVNLFLFFILGCVF